MSFNDYVNHIIQKFRLAISIAVLRTKPEHLPIEEYINILKNKMNEQNMETDDPDISICSDDFILDDNDAERIINDENDDAEHMNNDNFNDKDDNPQHSRIHDEILTIDDEIEINNSMTILKDFDLNIKPVEGLEGDYFLENFTRMSYYEGSEITCNPTATETDRSEYVTKSKKAYNDNLGPHIIQNGNTTEDDTELSKYMNNRIAANISKNINKHFTTDSKTMDICEGSINNKTLINEETNSLNKNERTNAITSERHENITTPINIIKESSTKQRDNNIIINLEELNDSEYNKTQNEYLANKIYNNLNKDSKAQIKKVIDDKYKVNMTIDLKKLNYSECSNEYNDEIATTVCKNLKNPTNLNENIQKDSQDTQLYSLHGFTQNCTHVSQSQSEDIQVGEQFILGNKERNIENYPNITDSKDTFVPSCYNMNMTSGNYNKDFTSTDQTLAHIENKKGHIINNNNLHRIEINSGEIQYVVDKNGTQYAILKQNYAVKEDIETNITKNDAKTQVYSNTVSSQEAEFEEELTKSQTELVPFKVIEELNKVKMFLNRRERTASASVSDGNTSDSGYRSDSQSRSVYKCSLQLSGNWVNQSGHCLFNYLLQCPLVASTQDITKEISLVLGRLIDRLHDDENYPSFLEDILETIDLLLHDVYEGESSCDNVLLKKDKNIQLVFLLNKSTHILKYTIEKINTILENAHTFLTSEETYELTNIEKIENLSYIFHILEVLLKRYVKDKPVLTQDSTQSQNEEKLLKRSSITDIWRKKWNPETKSVKSETNTDKRNALTKCGETLNKIVVECINGYSLIAFAALQCFNLLQSQ